MSNNVFIKLYKYMFYNSISINKKFKNYNNFINFCMNQKGASKKYSVEYHNNKYIFKQAMDYDVLILSSFDKFENECISVNIDKTTKIANINSINATTPNCIHSNTKIGTKLLKLTLKMLEKYKDKLDIKVITLSDKSYLYCHQKNIELSYLSVLTSGHTWYGKYAFRPIKYQGTYPNYNVIQDKYLSQVYENNVKIMDNLTINKIKWNKYITKPKLLKAIDLLINEQPNMLVKDFIKNLLLEWNRNCDILSDIYIELFNDIGLIHTNTLYGKFI